MPIWLGYVIAAIELFGGLAILISIKTCWVAWAFVHVIIVTALGHPFWTMKGAARAANQVLAVKLDHVEGTEYCGAVVTQERSSSNTASRLRQ